LFVARVYEMWVTSQPGQEATQQHRHKIHA
jgi:hypothetical protein